MDNEWLRFVRDTAPLVVAQFILPPLSVVDGKEAPMPQHQLLIQAGITANDLLALCYSEKQMKANQHYVLVTHMFVHQTYGHLLANVFGLWSAARALSMYSSTEFIYLVFFAGGTLSVVPTFLKEMQLLNTARRNVPLPDSIGFLPNSLDDKYKQLRESASQGAANAMRPLVHTMGSSGAVCALSGAGLVFDLHALLCEIFPSTRSRNATTRFRNAMRSTINAAMTLYYLYGQVQAVRGKSQIKISNIDFASHVQGFAVGAALAIGYMFWSNRRVQRKQVPPGPAVVQ